MKYVNRSTNVLNALFKGQDNNTYRELISPENADYLAKVRVQAYLGVVF